MGTITLPT